jgi:hypothetical protein
MWQLIYMKCIVLEFIYLFVVRTNVVVLGTCFPPATIFYPDAARANRVKGLRHRLRVNQWC